MNSIPHCRECENLHSYEIGKHTYYNCYNKEVWQTGMKIYSFDISTSPKWCPKRDNSKCSL